MEYDFLIHGITRIVELAGIAVMVVGALLSTAIFIREFRAAGIGIAYHRYRSNLGRSILLGLEILIVADIVYTIAAEPTITNILVLGMIVIIRIILSFALEIEISGQLPWRREPFEAPHQPPTSRRAAEEPTV